jgi:hypothetical protein
MTDQQKYEANLRAAERAHDQANEALHRLNEAAVHDAQAVIRIVLVINGGAAIAVLAFVGSLVSKGYSIPQVSGIISSASWFVFGTMATASTAVLAYLTNSCYAGSWVKRTQTWTHPYFQHTTPSKWWVRVAWAFHILALLTAFSGIVLFIVGMFAIFAALHSLR